MPFGKKISLTFLADINKLLVPTPPVYEIDSNGLPVKDANGNYILLAGKDPNVSVMQGMLQSFSDAPGGYKEEIREIYYSFGIEGNYNNKVFLRSGFFYEDKTKGNRKFFTLGSGTRFKNYQLDVSYTLPIEHPNPLENTIRFSFLFYFK